MRAIDELHCAATARRLARKWRDWGRGDKAAKYYGYARWHLARARSFLA